MKLGTRLLLVAAMIVTPVVVTASPASAHDTDHCYHGNIYNGGWTTAFMYHYTTDTGAHYNVYRHYLDGVPQHDEFNRCN
jgi:hypothetical protein